LLQFSISKDKNHVFGSMTYCSIIEDIWDVDYTMFIVPVFKFKCVDNKSSAK